MTTGPSDEKQASVPPSSTETAEPDRAGAIGLFIGGIVATVVTSPKVEALLKRLLSQLIRDEVVPLIPVAAAAAGAAIVKNIPGVENIRDVLGFADEIRETINDHIPDVDTGIKPLDALLDAWRL